MTALYIGLMSGTSADGVDAVLAEINQNDFTLIDSAALPYDTVFREHLLNLALSERCTKRDIGQVSTLLANYFSETTLKLISTNKLKPSDIKAIGSHGHTIDHAPNLDTPYTLQIGDHARLAELTGITCICDFRSRDIAAGGQGAPLVPAFHQWFFTRTGQQAAIVNIGGISNITLLESEKNDSIAGYDCGPGNCLLDSWHQQHTGETFDAAGHQASLGELQPQLLNMLLADDYFKAPPPKSTGREYFNQSWLNQYLNQYTISVEWRDISRTLVELTAISIINEAIKYKREVIYLCGGGAHNSLLRSRITEHAQQNGICTELTETLGLSGDWVEASAFAWMAQRTLSGQSCNLPSVTGARGHRILGAIYPA